MGEELLVPVGCSLSENWVLCLPCAPSFNIVPAGRKEESSTTVCSEEVESSAGATHRGSFPDDKERLFTTDGCHSCKKPVHTSIPLMPTTGT